MSVITHGPTAARSEPLRTVKCACAGCVTRSLSLSSPTSHSVINQSNQRVARFSLSFHISLWNNSFHRHKHQNSPSTVFLLLVLLSAHWTFFYLLGVIDWERLIFISCLIRLTVVAMTTGMLVVYPNSHSRETGSDFRDEKEAYACAQK